MTQPVLRTRIRAAWSEFGRIGRIAIVGIAISAGAAIALGISIPRAIESHLLDERVTTFERVVDEVVDAGLLPHHEGFAAVGDFVRLRIIGGDTVRVKLWSPDGEILWSDEPQLIGRRFELGRGGRRAFAGSTSFHLSSLRNPEHEFEAHFGQLLEFYIPVQIGDEVPYVFEVYQRSEPLTETVARARRTVWMSIALGLGTMGVFIVGAAVAVVRSADRRRRQAERLLDRLAGVRDTERSRLANAMHDDIGQPLYRLLYGLESLGGGDGESEEIGRLRTIARDVDIAIRDELRGLQDPALAGRDLGEVIREMEDVDPETPPSVRVRVDASRIPPDDTTDALYRAIREAVSNARRHAEAATIWISLEEETDRLVAEVRDDGSGRSAEPGLGTTLMLRLLATVGGRATTTAKAGAGTTVTITVPKEGTP